jgi:hypothetical protein
MMKNILLVVAGLAGCAVDAVGFVVGVERVAVVGLAVVAGGVDVERSPSLLPSSMLQLEWRGIS